MTEPAAFITGADRGLGLGLAIALAERSWRVFAGQYLPDWPELDEAAAASSGRITPVPLDVASAESVRAAAQAVAAQVPALDLLINNAGIAAKSHATIRGPLDTEEMQRVFDVNTLGPLRVAEAFLPLVERSVWKRLAFVSSEAGSIARDNRKGWFAYTMSKAALNRAVRSMFTDLRPQGFTFRLYHPGWVRSYMSGAKNMDAHLEPEQAAEYALAFFLRELDNEDELSMWDYEGQQWPW